MFQQIVLVDLAFVLAFKGVGPEFLQQHKLLTITSHKALPCSRG